MLDALPVCCKDRNISGFDSRRLHEAFKVLFKLRS
uniref:Uncharacterized protein n=1 Tax=Siphoviridae sp. ct13O11 TaxID=2825303 RepID=A0A8S5UDG0_9CAUD|nr:MAG TPA: hypothetical protein [Siphoviridae sp. ct13O11]